MPLTQLDPSLVKEIANDLHAMAWMAWHTFRSITLKW